MPALSLPQTKSDCLNHKSLCFWDYFLSKKVHTTQIFRKQAIHLKATTSICMVCEKAFTAATASVGQCWITSAGHGRPLLRFTVSGRQRGPGCIPLVSGTPSDSQPRPPLRWLPSPLGGVVWEQPFPLKLYQNIFPWEVWFDQLALQFNSFMRNIPKYLYRGSIALPSLRPVTGLHMIRWSEPRLRQLVKFKSPVWTCSLQSMRKARTSGNFL